MTTENGTGLGTRLADYIVSGYQHSCSDFAIVPVFNNLTDVLSNEMLISVSLSILYTYILCSFILQLFLLHPDHHSKCIGSSVAWFQWKKSEGKRLETIN